MWSIYKFKKTNGELIFHLEITSSFVPSVFFEIFREDEKYIVYWRKALNKSEYFDLLSLELKNKISCCCTLKELVNTTEYMHFLDKFCPLYEYVLNDYQKEIVNNLLEYGLNKDVHIPCGRDGHSYYFELYRHDLEKFHCWYILPEKWKNFKLIIDLLVNDISGLDYEMYGIKNQDIF
jgi:hypothetical protein